MNYYRVNLSVSRGYSVFGLASAAQFLITCGIPAHFESRHYLKAELSERELHGLREHLKRDGARIKIEAELSDRTEPARRRAAVTSIDGF